MFLSKAIEILEIFHKQEGKLLGPDFTASTQLGIEALKRHQALQTNPYYTLLKLLPGETPENEK